jgi:hypothetical protein
MNSVCYQFPWTEKCRYFKTKKKQFSEFDMVEAVLTDGDQLYCLAFAENSVDRQWDTVILFDESAFSSANYGLVYFT